VRARQQAAVADIGQRALQGIDLVALFDETVRVVAQTLDADYCKVLEMLPDGKALLLRSGVGWQEGVVGQALITTELYSQAGYILAANKPVIIEDLRTETRFKGTPLLHKHGVVSGMSVVIAGDSRPFGVLSVHSRSKR